MFKYIEMAQFVNYLKTNYKSDTLIKILEGGGIKVIQEDEKYKMIFLSLNAKVDCVYYYQQKINKLFNLVLNGTYNVELVWDEKGKYDTPEDKEQRETDRLAIEKQEKEEHLKRVEWLFKESRIPQIKRNVFIFDNYKCSQENSKSIEVIKKYQTGFLTICGATGLGKTHLAVAVGQSFIGNELSVIYYQVEELLDMLRHTYDKDEGSSFDGKMNELKECDLLVLDDFGTQKNTDWVLSKLDTIIDNRYVNEKSTIITSNLSLKAIGDVSERIASRLSSGIIITLVGTDYRASHKMQIDKIPTKQDDDKFVRGKYGRSVQR